MRKLAYTVPVGDLASRNQAIPQRHKIESIINDNNLVELDLSGVFSISESYSDEIFGVLVIKFGKQRVLNQLKIRNASPAILKSIAKVIQRRDNEIQLKKVYPEYNREYSCVAC